MPRTNDRLADPRRRDIQTSWTLDEHTKDGQTVLTLETAVSKRRAGQVLVTDIYVQYLEPDGALIRSFALFEASVGAGIDIAIQQMPRYNTKKALLQHEAILADLPFYLDQVSGHKAYPEMRRLLDLALRQEDPADGRERSEARHASLTGLA